MPAPTEFVPVPTADTCLLESASSRPLTPACRNALLNVHYTLIHRTNSENNIVAAYVDLVLTDVPLAASNDDGKIVLQQEYSVEFQDVSNSPRNLANLINRSKSGNPGYIYGRPVLAGHAIAATSQLDAVSPRARGLQLLGADNDGTCTDAATERVTLSFGVDMRSGCLLQLNYSQVQDFCVGHGVHVTGNAVPRYFNVSNIFDANKIRIPDALIGLFGNADPLDASQWVNVDVQPTIDAAAWQERTWTCENAVTSMNYRFIWGYVGSRSNPQAKIIAVRLDFGKSDIKYRFDSNSEDKKQSITITATASFIQRTGGSDASSPPSPPVAISVPYDVWYPFKIDSHAGFAPPGILKTTFIIFVLTTFHLSRQSTMAL